MIELLLVCLAGFLFAAVFFPVATAIFQRFVDRAAVTEAAREAQATHHVAALTSSEVVLSDIVLSAPMPPAGGPIRVQLLPLGAAVLSIVVATRLAAADEPDTEVVMSPVRRAEVTQPPVTTDVSIRLA